MKTKVRNMSFVLCINRIYTESQTGPSVSSLITFSYANRFSSFWQTKVTAQSTFVMPSPYSLGHLGVLRAVSGRSWELNANSSKTVKATDFKFEDHILSFPKMYIFGIFIID